jgi:chromosome segregation ATPase
VDTIEGIVRQERVPATQEELSTRIEEVRKDIEFLSRRLERLAKLQSLLKEKYHRRLEALFDQLDSVDKQQCELKSLAGQLKKNKERREILKKQVLGLKRRKETIRGTIKQVKGYEKSCNAQIEVIDEEQEVLSQRVHDLMQMLDLAEQAELNGKELELISGRIYATKRLLEEHEINLRKRIIDLLFEFYIPPRNNRKFKW